VFLEEKQDFQRTRSPFNEIKLSKEKKKRKMAKEGETFFLDCGFVGLCFPPD
jgi:hypothetical protein